jgi:hypothetical protein
MRNSQFINQIRICGNHSLTIPLRCSSSCAIVDDVKAKLRLPSPAGSMGYACARVMTSPRFASALLVSVVVWEFGVLFLKASRKLFWYDELITFHVSTLQPFSLLWRALQAGVDAMPPGYYAIVQLGRMLPGDPHVTLRLSSILGYMLTLLGIYWLARKRLPVSAGLTAVLLITLSPFRGYALEARSYALLVGFLAISAALWQRIDEKRFMTPLLALFLTLAVSCHHLAVVAISSFGIAELTWTLLSRRIRWGVWAACLVASCPFFVSLPLLLRFRDIYAQNFWSRPTWGTALSTYGEYLGLDSRLALVLIFFLGIVVGDSLLRMVRRPRERSAERDFGPPEIILVGGFLFYPALLVVLTKLLDSGYSPRYGWPAILGLVLGPLCLFRTIWLQSSSVRFLGALLIAFAVQGYHDFTLLSKAGSNRVDERWTGLAELSRDEPGMPVVIGSGMTYLEAAEYAPPELRDRLVQLVDADIGTRLAGSDTVDKTNRLLAQFIPLRVEDLALFQAAHQRFILHSGGGRFDWLTRYLVDRRYHLRLFSKDTVSSIYLV